MFRTGRQSILWSLLLFAAVVLAVYQPWGLGLRELQRTEGLAVAEALEYRWPPKLVVEAHGMIIPGAYPVFPALGHALQHLAPYTVPAAFLPYFTMPFILRLISLAALVLSAVTVAAAAASVRDRRAGWVAGAVYLTSLISIEKGCEGVPATLAALPVLLGQLLFFHFGYRRNRWNIAWIAALVLASLAFLVDGFQALLYFFFPFFFFRRPLSVRTRFHYPGFWAGALLLGSVIALYLEVTHLHAGETHSLRLFWDDVSSGSYFLTLLAFPFRLAGRLFPWILIAWFPLCVALQALDRTPIYGRFLRTLTLSTLTLLWLHPDIDPRNIFYLLGPLAIQIGMYYELGVRRYGHRLLKTGPLLELFVLLTALLFLILPYVPQKLLDQLAESARLGFGFMEKGGYVWSCYAAATLLAGAALLIRRLRRVPLPAGYRTIWGMLLAAAVCCGIINCQLLRPYRAQERPRRDFAAELTKRLNGKPKTLYKIKIVGLYAELYYAGIPHVKDVAGVEQLPPLPKDKKAPEPEPVYLLSASFPEEESREWLRLKEFLDYHGSRFSLWKGTPRKETVLNKWPLDNDTGKGEKDE